MTRTTDCDRLMASIRMLKELEVFMKKSPKIS